MKMTKIKLEDRGQDLTYVFVGMFEDSNLGQINQVNPAAVAGYSSLIGKAFNIDDNQPGMLLNFANPAKGFEVTTLDYIVLDIDEGDSY